MCARARVCIHMYTHAPSLTVAISLCLGSNYGFPPGTLPLVPQEALKTLGCISINLPLSLKPEQANWAAPAVPSSSALTF